MKGYGQFCPVAVAAEVFAERWTPLIVRELFSILRTVNEREHVSMLVVEQNAAMALDLSDHAYLIETGRVVLSGTSDEIKRNDAVRRSYLGY